MLTDISFFILLYLHHSKKQLRYIKDTDFSKTQTKPKKANI